MSISPQSLARTRDKRSLKIPARFDDFMAENEPKKTAAIKKKDNNNIIMKSPFHPSITISNGVRTSESDGKTSIENKPTTISSAATPSLKVPSATDLGMKVPDAIIPTVKTPAATEPSIKISTTITPSIKPPPKKISKGFSLIKNNDNNEKKNPSPNLSNLQAINKNNRGEIGNLMSLTQGMQFGRWLKNEPIYLPRSVPTIAPITTTLQQIADKAKSFASQSKKVEACIAYQEERKLNFLASNYTALVKITKHLEVRDLLNLRATNKSWKSIVDSDAVWKRVTIKSSSITDWSELGKWMVKYRSTDLVLDEAALNSSSNILEALEQVDVRLKRLWIRTTSSAQNACAMQLIWRIVTRTINIPRIIWRVKVLVDDMGLALVEMDKLVAFSGVRSNPNWYKEYKEKHELQTFETPESLVTEVSDLGRFFTDCDREVPDCTSFIRRPQITIKPI